MQMLAFFTKYRVNLFNEKSILLSLYLRKRTEKYVEILALDNKTFWLIIKHYVHKRLL